MEDEKKSVAQKIWSIVRFIIILFFALGIIVAAILFAASKSPNKSLFGYRYYTVLTPSMEPTYKVGDMVFVKLSHANEIKVGDVITFNPSSETSAYLTHRVTEKLENYEGSGVTCFKTKGDANKDEDGFLIDEARVIGKVTFSIPKLGYVSRFIQLKWYYVIPLIVLFFVFLKLVDTYVEAKDDEGEEENEQESSDDIEKEQENSSTENENSDDIPTENREN